MVAQSYIPSKPAVPHYLRVDQWEMLQLLQTPSRILGYKVPRFEQL